MQREKHTGDPIDPRPLVCVVDDDALVRGALRRLLSTLGLRVALFATPEDLLREREVDEASCLLIDFELPGMSGFKLYSQLNASGRRVPAIFMTARSDRGLRATAMELGAVAFLRKPFDDSALKDLLEKTLGYCVGADGAP